MISLAIAGTGLAPQVQAQDSPFSGFQRQGAILPVTEAFIPDLSVDALGTISISWTVAEGYYLYRDALAVSTGDGTPLSISVPDGMIKDDLSFGRVEVYPADFTIILTDPVPPEITLLHLAWQGCQDEGICFPPQTTALALPTVLATAGVTGDRQQLPDAGTQAANLPSAAGSYFDSLHSQGGTLWLMVAFFGLGVVLAFSPCTFPMIPVIWALVGGTAGTSRSGTATLRACAYVIGMAAGFAALGAIAGLSGTQVQFMLQHPSVILSVAALFAAMGFATLGLWELRMPARLQTLMQNPRHNGASLAGVAGLGLGSVLVLGPCVTAPFAAALLYIATTGDMALGTLALGAFGLGQGMPLMVVALAGRRVLPKSGPWMSVINRVFAALLFAMAVLMVTRLVTGGLSLALWSGYALVLAAAISAPETANWRGLSLRALRMGVLGIAILQAIGAMTGGRDPLAPLASLTSHQQPELFAQSVSDPAALASALAEFQGQPIILYASADWCLICLEIERDTFTSRQLHAALGTIGALKLDLTDYAGTGGELARGMDIIGPPTFLFLDAAHQPRRDLTLIGATDAEAIITRLAAISPPV